MGYVLLDISTNYDYVDSARRIETAEELCRLMLEDIALDVLLLTENEHSIETADPLELSLIHILMRNALNSADCDANGNVQTAW